MTEKTVETRPAQSGGRVAYYDGLRIAAMVGVILIHVCAKYATSLAADGQALGIAWHLANLLDAAGRFAVPVYLMITGGLLLGSDSSLSVGTVLKKRVVRVAVPLVFWTAVYIVLQAATVTDYDWKAAVLSLFSQPAEVHLWYLYALIAVYLLLPLLRLIVKYAPRRLLWYGVGLWLIFSCLWRAAAGLIPALALPDYANLDLLGGYLGYVLLGWLLSTQPRTPRRGLCLAAALAGAAVTAAATWVMTRRAGELNGVFYQYFMPNVILTAAGVFLWFRGMGEKRMRPPSPVWQALSGLSFGVYLSHEVFVRLLEPVFAPLPAAAGMLLLSAAVLLISLAVSWVLERIPGVRFVTLGERRR